jgi:3-oxoadipate enol-lactonase
MPHITANGIRIHYRFDGPEDAPVLMLSNSLGTTLEMWDAQLPALSRDFRVLRYDTRGHGQSEVPAGEYSIEQLGRDVVGLLDALGLEQVHFCGLSIGGLTGQWLGLNAPQRLRRLVVANTAARIGNTEGWNARIAQVGQGGMAEVAAGAVARWFTPEFVRREPAAVETVRQQLLATAPAGYAGGCAAVRDADFRSALTRLRLPLLVVAGLQDPVTTPEDARFIATAVAGARQAALAAAHLSNIEARMGFDAAVLGFLGAA